MTQPNVNGLSLSESTLSTPKQHMEKKAGPLTPAKEAGDQS
jgi:hypothetical protein